MILLVLSHLGLGLAVWLGPHEPHPDYAILFEYLPWWVRSGLWVSMGAAAFIFAYTKHRRAAWVVLSLMPIVRAIGYAWSALMFLIPGAPGGVKTAFPSLVVWLSVVALVWLLAGWPDLEKQTRGVPPP